MAAFFALIMTILRFFSRQIQPRAAACLLLLVLAGCGGGYYSGMGWPQSDQVVTNNPKDRPDIAWQTAGQRRELSQEDRDYARLKMIENGMEPLKEAAPAQPAKNIGVRPVKVSLLLPLSGKNADLGNAMLKSAQMALLDVGSAHFELLPQDTAGTGGATSAVRLALQQKSDLILGPIFSDEVKATKPLAAAANVPMIAFTTDWTLADSNTYIMGFMPFAQVARVAQFAQRHGYAKVSALAAATEYGDVSLNALGRSGVSVGATKRYNPGTADLKKDVEDFVAANSILKDDGTRQLSFNALLLPQGGESLRTLVSLLDLNGVKNENARLLGTGLWDDPALLQMPSLYGAWFAAPDPNLRRDFEKRYQDNFGEAAPRLASLSYDATALAAVLARNTNGNNPYSRDQLNNPRGFAGIDGLFRFRPDGLTERALAVLEVQAGKLQIADPAPTAFATP